MVHIINNDGSWLRTTIDKCTNHDEAQHLGCYCVRQHRSWLIFEMICLIAKFGKLLQKILLLADYLVTVLDICELTRKTVVSSIHVDQSPVNHQQFTKELMVVVILDLPLPVDPSLAKVPPVIYVSMQVILPLVDTYYYYIYYDIYLYLSKYIFTYGQI